MSPNKLLTRREFTARALLAAAGTAVVQAAATPAPIRCGLCTSFGRAAAVKTAGGDYVEENAQAVLVPEADGADFVRLLEKIRQSPLPVPVCNGFIRRPDLLCVGPRANHDAVMQHVTVTLQRAARAGVKTIVFGSSSARQRPDGWSVEQAMAQFAALLKRMGPIAGDQGVVIAVEPLNTKECNFLNRIGEVAEVVVRADHPSIRATADLYHMILDGDTPDDLRKVAKCVHHIHLAEPKGRAYPRPGGADFRGFFRVLRETGYTGMFSIEAKGNDTELTTAFTELRMQWREAG